DKPDVPAAPPADPPTVEKKSELDAPTESVAAAVAAISAAYTVQRGQSLWSIAADKLGNGVRYREILDLNPQLRPNPGRIVPGQELNLPAPNVIHNTVRRFLLPVDAL